ncbi:nickel pincer cofactor biosynthesis protein LarC [Halalkalicoccus subterraneus]|uniref:nickel pincer cofactor biosynthesis protein LarC n=1 Tax=Halalkalicoccus subterraneus TaxID=2675002 RepID=UPI000EFD4BF8|nr:nickel pincer cofactor biosynthesis protein LarC [Halalkalicoccus subterraneus]
MSTLAFDGRTGASGDMIVGALLAAGADPDVLGPVESTLDVRYGIDDVMKNDIRATGVDVVRDDRSDPGHDRHGEHDQGRTHAEGTGPHRSYREVCELVESMGLASEVEADALAIFETLGEAEASVHGADLDSIHFHEVGADDAIADVVGAVLLLADLDPDRVVTTPLSAGGGVVEMSHGTYPVPGPAVVKVAEKADWSIRGGPVEAELLTPTGAAILAVVAEGCETLPDLRVEGSGYGAGDRDLDGHPNVLRAIVGDAHGNHASHEGITVLETNVDDIPPEILGGLQDTLAGAGARDVTVLPATMKKSRPGHLVKVICRPEDARAVARKLAAETGTLGVRATPATHRWVAGREIETVSIAVDGEDYGIAIKIASDDSGEVYDASPEYDDAAAVARETGATIREVMARAESAWREL